MARDIQNKLPTPFDLDVIRKKFGPGVSPTTVVLLQELERFNRLLVRMSCSLVELQRVREKTSVESCQEITATEVRRCSESGTVCVSGSSR